MAKTKVVLLNSGFNQLRKCPEMRDALTEMINGTAERAGKGYGADVKVMPTRLVANAYPADIEAIRATDKSAGAELIRGLRG